MSVLQFQSARSQIARSTLSMTVLVGGVLALTACGTREPETDPARLSQLTSNPPTETRGPSPEPTPNLIPAVESGTAVTRPQGTLDTTPARVNVLVGYTESSSTAARSGSDRLIVIPAGSPIYAFPAGTDGFVLNSDTRYRDRSTGITYVASQRTSEIYLVHVQSAEEVCGNRFDDNGNGQTDESCPGTPASPTSTTITITNAVGTPVGGTSSQSGGVVDCNPFGPDAQPVGAVATTGFVGVASGSLVGMTTREEGVLSNGFNYTVPAGSLVYVMSASFNGYALPEGTQISSDTYGSFRVPSVSTSNSRYVVKIQGAPELCGNLFDDNANGSRDETCNTVIVR